MNIIIILSPLSCARWRFMRAALLSLSLRFPLTCEKKLHANDCFFFSPLWLCSLSVCRWRLRRRGIQQKMPSLVSISVRKQMQVCVLLQFHFGVFWIFKALGVRILTRRRRLQTRTQHHNKNAFSCLPRDLPPLFKSAKLFHRVASCSAKFW